MNNLNEIIRNATPEQKQKVFACKSEDELLALAKIEGNEISAEQAKQILIMITPQYGEISDDELEAVAGGKECAYKHNRIGSGACTLCGSENIAILRRTYSGSHFDYHCYCMDCKKEFTVKADAIKLVDFWEANR